MGASDRPAERLRPVLDGDSWLIGPNPPLAELGAERPGEGSTEGLPAHQCVDHHLYQGPDGAWHLWGCIRGTPVGRILYHWEGESLDAGPWRQTGEILRVDRLAGESLDDRGARSGSRPPLWSAMEASTGCSMEATAPAWTRGACPCPMVIRAWRARCA
ncbi:MAG: hypothetical protein ISS56_07845 [Anaerolineae bacterium]|nr:hypothetical protein [Anaerolineae bacterium]